VATSPSTTNVRTKYNPADSTASRPGRVIDGTTDSEAERGWGIAAKIHHILEFSGNFGKSY
jgi:hypothetical protein